MTKWLRGSELTSLHTLARKARRRGDAADTARWYRAINLKQMADDRFEAALRVAARLEREEAERQAASEPAPRKRRPTFRDIEARMNAELGIDQPPRNADRAERNRKQEQER